MVTKKTLCSEGIKPRDHLESMSYHGHGRKSLTDTCVTVRVICEVTVWCAHFSLKIEQQTSIEPAVTTTVPGIAAVTAPVVITSRLIEKHSSLTVLEIKYLSTLSLSFATTSSVDLSSCDKRASTKEEGTCYLFGLKF